MGGKEKIARPWLLDLKPVQTKIDGGVFYRYRWKDNVGLNAGLNYLRIGGADSLSTNPARASRNLHFKSTIIELSGRAEYYFYTIHDVGGKGRYQLDFRAFAFGGLAGFYFNPRAEYNDKWVSLRPYTTEGIAYSRIQLAIPFGTGFFFTYKRVHRFGWEFNVRKTFTDYLDDVKGYYIEQKDPTAAALANRYDSSYGIQQENYYPGNWRGDRNNHDDWYLSTSFQYSYVLKGKSNYLRKKHPYTYSHGKHKRRTKAKF